MDEIFVKSFTIVSEICGTNSATRVSYGYDIPVACIFMNVDPNFESKRFLLHICWIDDFRRIEKDG